MKRYAPKLAPHGTGWVTSATADEFDSIPWFTDQHAREAAERMKAWASGAGHVPQLAASVLSDAEWLNLARVALELRVRA